MWFKKPRKKQKTDPNVVKVNQVIAVFLLLALLHNLFTRHTLLPGNNNSAQIKNSIVKAAPNTPISFDNIRAMMPESVPLMSIKDQKEGTGAPAVCGQKVSIAYTTATADETPVDDSADREHPLTFRIGEHKAIPAFEQGVVGMSKGGERLVFAPGKDAYDAPGFERKDVPPGTRVVFDIELLDTMPALPEAADTIFRIITVQKGIGHPLLCGEPAKVLVTIWSIEGKKLFPLEGKEPEAISFTPGNSEVFLGLEQGVIGMNGSSRRTLIVPPDFQKTMDGNAPKIHFPFPPKQTVLVDVEAVS